MQRDRLRRLLDRSADPAFVLTPRGEIWGWNPAAAALLGYAPAEAAGQSFTALLRPRGPLGQPVRDDYAARAVHEGTVPSFDMRVRTRAGTHVWLNVSVLVLDPLPPSPALVLHLAHDITASRRRRALYERLLESARHIVQLADEDHHLVPVSPLTEQEERILHRFATGATPAQVARELGISTQTLRNHLHHVNQKLGTHNRLEAVIHAVRRRLI